MLSNTAHQKASVTIFHPFSWAWGATVNHLVKTTDEAELLDEVTMELIDVMEHMQKGRVDEAITVLGTILQRLVPEATVAE